MADLDKVTEELEALSKAKEDEGKEEESLEKAISDATEALAAFKKSKDNDEDDKGGDSDAEGESDGEDDEDEDEGEGAEPDIKKSLEEALGEELADELVKSSEAFAALSEDMLGGFEAVDTRFEGLEKSMGSQAKLGVAMAKALIGLTAKVDALTKLVGAAPAAASGARVATEGEEISKSRTDVYEALTKAVQENKVEPSYLTIFATRGVMGLPKDVLAEIGCA